MKYEEMVSYLRSRGIKELAEKIGVPINTLSKFLSSKGYFNGCVKADKFAPKKRPRVNPLFGFGEDSKYNQEELTDIQKRIVHGSLLGDMYAGWSSENHTAYLKCEHAWSEIGYLKALYELLRPFSFSPYLDKPQKGLQDYQVGFTCHSSKYFAPLRKLFYTVNDGSPHLQKDVFSPGVLSLLDPLSLAFWVMDDGKKYGAAFSISIGKQSYYSRERAENAAIFINNLLGTDFKVHEETLSYGLYVTKGSAVIDLIRPYIYPDLSYKIHLTPDECGSFYKDFPWYQEWLSTRRSLMHPTLEKRPYSKSYYASLQGNEKIRYDRAVFSQVRVRGFPFVDEPDLSAKYERMKSAAINVDEGVLIYDNSYNVIPNSFMNHRYILRVRGCKSPYEIFFNNKELKATIERQLRDGPALNNSNIRAALSVYRTQVVGQFNPLFAKYFCDNYCCLNGNVFDPCAGFGSRMVGVMSSGRHYLGIDPAPLTITALGKLIKWLNYRSLSKAFVIRGCAEYPLIKSESFDMAITSPPYFNKEEYAYDGSQSFVKFPGYDLWLTGFLGPMIQNVYRVLKVNAVFILNIDNVDGFDVSSDALTLSEKAGFRLEKTFRSSPLRRPGNILSDEPFFVLRKD